MELITNHPGTADVGGTERRDVVVVGAGLAGLAAAALLRRRGVDAVVVDGHVPGGRGRTDTVDGFRFNRGAHALYLGGHARRVLDDLGVALGGGAPTTEAYGRRGDVVGRLPGGARTLLTTSLIGWRGKVGAARVLRGVARWDAPSLAGVSVAEWVDGMHLPAEAADLVLALVRVSSYGNAPEIMSADVAASQIQLALSSGVRYLDGGWQSLVDALVAQVEVRRASVVGVHAGAGGVEVGCSDGSTIEAASAVLAVGTPGCCCGAARTSAVRVRPADRGVVPRPRHVVSGATPVPVGHRPPAVPVDPPAAGPARPGRSLRHLADALPRAR